MHYAPLSARRALIQASVALAALLIVSFVLNLVVLSQLQHAIAQQNLYNTFQTELKEGTAPVSEGTFDDVLLKDGDPVALIDIPQIGLKEVVVEGTDGGTLKAGPGHRRDSVLPGQVGTSVLMARAAAYGGPFARIQELVPGDQFTVTTGQGEQKFAVIGVRYAGDPTPPALAAGVGRLTLITARGPAYIPTGIAYVDAQTVDKAVPSGTRQTTYIGLPPEAKPLATDTRTLWAFVFALQFLLLVAVAVVWSVRLVGRQKTWIVAVPVAGLALILAADQVVLLLPNLL